ncbi:MAG: LamG domain-containing protein, partial [bacterium]|nr:LamG domain-containing protein [bacterium]
MEFRPVFRFILTFFAVSFFLLLSPHSAHAASSLVGYWKFDEGAGTSAADSSGNGNTGTLTNGPTWSATVPTTAFTNPYALDFDGVDDHIPTQVIAATDEVTFTGWFNPRNVTSHQSIGSDANSAGAVINFHMEVNSNGSLGMLWGGGAPYLRPQGATTLSLNQWYHGAVVRSGSTGAWNYKIYLNGTQDASGTTSINPGAASTFTIGRPGEYSGQYFDGLIDDFRIYSRALSATEITALAAGTHTTVTWAGTTSTDYAIATNWDTGAVPDPYSHVVIANTSNKPILTANESLASVTINSSAILDLSSYDLTINDSGTFSNSGTLKLNGSQTLTNFTNDTDSGTVMYTGTSNQTGLKAGNSYYNLNINDGLVGYWKLDEGAGTSAADSSGHGNSGTLTNGPTWSADPTNSISFTNPYALDFDGVDDYVDGGNNNSLTFGAGNSFSYSVWFKQDTAQSGWRGLVYHDSAGKSQGHIGLQATTRYLSGGTGDGSTWQTNSSTYVPVVNTWVHAVVTLDRGTNVMKLYADGVEVGSFAHAHVPASPTLGLRIGEGSPGTERFDGSLDDVRIYNRALTASEVSSLAAGTQPASATATYTLNSALDINGDFTLASGGVDVSASNYAITNAGSWYNYGGVFTKRAGTVTFDGTATGKTLQSGNQDFYNTTISGSGGGWTLTQDLYATNSLTQSNGTLNTSTSNYNIYAGTLNQTAGTLTTNSSRITVDSASNQTLNASSTLYNLDIGDNLKRGLVGYWKLDEGTGTSAADSSGNSNTGTLTNGPTWVAGAPKMDFTNPYSLDFDGTDDYVVTQSLPVGVDFTKAFSVSVWAKRNADGGFDGIVSGSTVASNGWNISFRDTTDQWSIFTHTTAGFYILQDATSQSLDFNWRHLVLVSDGTTVWFYFDGVLQTATGDSPTSIVSSVLNFGRFYTGTSDHYLNGLIDDVRIYNRALSSTDITELYNGAHNVLTTSTTTGTYTLGSALTVSNALNIQAGTLDVSASNYAVSTGTWADYGTWVPRSGT